MALNKSPKNLLKYKNLPTKGANEFPKARFRAVKFTPDKPEVKSGATTTETKTIG